MDQVGYIAYTRHYGVTMARADPVVANTIANLKPCSDIVSFKGTANRWRHFEKLKEFPANYLVLGDAYCAFTPFYGQGMRVAGLSALSLQKALQKFCQSATPDFRSVQKYYFRKTSTQIKAPWIIATGEDLRWPTTTGAAPDLVMHVSNAIMDQLLPLSTKSELLVRNFLRISNMIASPATLLDPRIWLQLFRFWIGR